MHTIYDIQLDDGFTYRARMGGDPSQFPGGLDESNRAVVHRVEITENLVRITRGASETIYPMHRVQMIYKQAVTE